MHLEFVVAGTPVSQQASPRSRTVWKKEVQEAAKKEWGTAPPFTGEVMVTITYFSEGKSPLDVDNMAKPILDALAKPIYCNDSQVTDLLSRKRDLNRNWPIPNPSSVLLKYLKRSERFVHITVVDAPNQEVAAC